MAAKYQLITELYRRTGITVAKNPQAWQSFLAAACRNYKCRFDEQLLIYAQRPDAIAVAELDTWNKRFREFVYVGDPVPELNEQEHAAFLMNIQKSILLSLEKRKLLTHSQRERCLVELEKQYSREQKSRRRA